MSESNIILAIVGFSSAGKDTLAKYAHDNLGYNFVVSHSTRPMRAGESQGNPYYFINDNEMCSLFVQNKLIEAREYDSVYGKWFYAVSKDEIEDSKKYVVVVDFSGFLALKNHFGDRVKSVFIDCSEPERRKRAELRGDFNLDEWNRRYEDDKAKFPKKLISKHMDWILKTTKYSKEKSENDLKVISFLAESIGCSGEKND